MSACKNASPEWGFARKGPTNMITTGLIVIGFILLFLGGEALVRGSVGIARKLGLSEMLIGLQDSPLLSFNSCDNLDICRRVDPP